MMLLLEGRICPKISPTYSDPRQSPQDTCVYHDAAGTLTGEHSKALLRTHATGRDTECPMCPLPQAQMWQLTAFLGSYRFLALSQLSRTIFHSDTDIHSIRDCICHQVLLRYFFCTVDKHHVPKASVLQLWNENLTKLQSGEKGQENDIRSRGRLALQ